MAECQHGLRDHPRGLGLHDPNPGHRGGRPEHRQQPPVPRAGIPARRHSDVRDSLLPGSGEGRTGGPASRSRVCAPSGSGPHSPPQPKEVFPVFLDPSRRNIGRGERAGPEAKSAAQPETPAEGEEAFLRQARPGSSRSGIRPPDSAPPPLLPLSASGPSRDAHRGSRVPAPRLVPRKGLRPDAPASRSASWKNRSAFRYRAISGSIRRSSPPKSFTRSCR